MQDNYHDSKPTTSHPLGSSTPKRRPKTNLRRPIAPTIHMLAANLARRTAHPREDLEQIAMVGIILAGLRKVPERCVLRPFARRYANGGGVSLPAGSEFSDQGVPQFVGAPRQGPQAAERPGSP